MHWGMYTTYPRESMQNKKACIHETNQNATTPTDPVQEPSVKYTPGAVLMF